MSRAWVAMVTLGCVLCGGGMGVRAEEAVVLSPEDRQALETVQRLVQGIGAVSSQEELEAVLEDTIRFFEGQQRTAPGRRAAEWQQVLNLDDTQRVNVERILRRNIGRNARYFRVILNDVHESTQSPSLTIAEATERSSHYLEEAKAIERDTVTELKQVLTPQQRQEFDELYTAGSAAVQTLVNESLDDLEEGAAAEGSGEDESTTPPLEIPKEYRKALLGGTDYWENVTGDQDR